MGEVKQLQPGELFARRYQIERPLKAGGMGAVYIVRHVETSKRLALKVMQPEIVAKPELRQRFIQEAQISAMIDEPDHVVDVTDAGVDEATGNPFIVMELLQGQDFSDVLEQRTMGPEELIPILRHVATALDAAHAKGVVHRDMKPENIYLVQRPNKPVTAKVLDFGIAKIVQNAVATSTMTGGTPLYMAPEQTKKSAHITAATDIWPLGLIAYRALVGRTYWEADDIHGLFGEILVGQYESAVARAARAGVQLPPEFDGFFLRCVALKPEQRFQQASAAVEALAQAFGRPTLAIPSARQAGQASTVYAAPAPGGPMSGSDPQMRPSMPSGSFGSGSNPQLGGSNPQLGGSNPSQPEVFPGATMQGGPIGYGGGTQVGPPAGYGGATQLGAPQGYGAPPYGMQPNTAPGVSHTAPGAPVPPTRPQKKGNPLPFILAGLAAAGLAAGGVWFFVGRGEDDKPKRRASAEDPPKQTSEASPDGTGTGKAPPQPSGTGGPQVVKSDDWRLEVEKLNPFIELGGIKIHKHEVTRAEYAKYLAGLPDGSRPAAKPLDDWKDDDAARARQPVVWVTWPQADGYCKALGGKLPSSMEWGVAVGNLYPWGDQWPSSVAGIAVDLPDGTAPLDAGASAKDTTKEGIQDLAGNVQEWTSPVTDGLAKVRGASIGMKAADAKSAIKEGLSKPAAGGADAAKEAVASSSVGFRCAK